MKPQKTYSSLFIVAHILFWIAVYFVPFIVNPRERANHHGMVDLGLIVNHALLIFLFYFNSYFLMAGFYRKRGVALYALALFGCLVAILLLSTLVHSPPPPPPAHAQMPFPPGPQMEPRPVGGAPSFLLMVILVGAISIIYRLILDKQEEERARKEKETEALKTELSFLRSQINPHFIFNALNSTLSLILKKSDKAADSLLKLSNLMRYMLYESDEEKVSLENEVGYIHDYVDLQMLRFGETITVTRHVEIDTPYDLQIEPMLLIPFIENAFKHGAVLVDQPEIRLRIEASGHALSLTVENKFIHQTRETKDESSGIGLVNVRRRLDLLYPNNYELTIEQAGDWFKIGLKINLDV